MKKNNPLISVIIVNWNGKKWLKKCFESLYKQTYPNFEIIFVDNASSDGSVEYVNKYWPKVKVIRNKQNLGFAGGNNSGLKVAKGKYVFLLNNDTWVESKLLEQLIKAFDEIPNLGSVQPKIVLMSEKDKLDMCGSYWTDYTFLYHFGYGKNSRETKYNRIMPFFGNKGAAMLIKMETIRKIGLFDDDFWNYYEETDFCHRLWIAGYECWYYPKTVVYHAMGGTSVIYNNSYIQFHNFKNKLLSFLKNFSAFSLIKIIPVYLFFNFLLSFVWLLQGKVRHFFAIYRAIFWNIIHIRKTLYKRRLIQSERKKSDGEIEKIVKKNPRISYLYYLFTDLQKYAD